jgi:cyclopropane-fatty-acyl-phospholipid synthase
MLGSLGVAEAYMDGDIETDSVFGLCRAWLSQEKPRFLLAGLPSFVRRAQAALLNMQSVVRAQRDVSRHYDIGNDLYEPMLAGTWTYSCGRYGPDTTDLRQAQINKYRLVCDKLRFERGMTVYEIGCGWGAFAEFAAKNYGVNVFGVTISKEQARVAHERCAGLPVRIELLDYRKVPQEYPQLYDRIVSIGMFEHVGPKNYGTYFKSAAASLKPDGLMLLHTIVGWGVDPFIDKYIFPGGVLPRESQIAKASKRYLVAEDMQNFGFDYYKTLIAWRNNCREVEAQLRASNPKYDDRFWRMWYFYLESCAAAFYTRSIQLQQWVFSKGIAGGYESIRPMYKQDTVVELVRSA